MEARARIELAYKGFADLSLTTWVPRPRNMLSIAKLPQSQPVIWVQAHTVRAQRILSTYGI